ncbi:hypothetical protein [Saccharothrix hoggarensis]|uniref:Secreted protein with PEP-CTERM sorting signal n=1 Tax=Saccharothrix hoggarensis TaxID=913853 RepID=A0ABW3QUG5_9PSEU
MRGRGAVLGVVLGAASSLVVDGVAHGADGSAAVAGSAVVAAPVSLEAPVGIAAVALGVVGLVAGLVRRRKAAVVRAAAERAEVQPATSGV